MGVKNPFSLCQDWIVRSQALQDKVAEESLNLSLEADFQ